MFPLPAKEFSGRVRPINRALALITLMTCNVGAGIRMKKEREREREQIC